MGDKSAAHCNAMVSVAEGLEIMDCCSRSTRKKPPAQTLGHAIAVTPPTDIGAVEGDLSGWTDGSERGHAGSWWGGLGL